MIQRVMLDGIELPRLYIAEDKRDADLAMSKGIPFIRWSHGQEELIRILLRPVLERMFPHIQWNKVLGCRRRFRTEVEIHDNGGFAQDIDDLTDKATGTYDWEHYDDEPGEMYPGLRQDEDGTFVETASVTTGERLFDRGGGMSECVKMDLADYVGDMSAYVNIEVLQRLHLMPAFIGDIMDCIKLNVGRGIYWREGYNKRLGLAVGRFDAAPQLPNLVILDISASIPRGISATMISLIDTLRTQLSADLIITSNISRFYPMGTELPSPQQIRDRFGYNNESRDFFKILNDRIRGRHYGHVISFGDNDTPNYDMFKHNPSLSLEGTIVEHVHHYHTGVTWWQHDPDDKLNRTGYAKWCHHLARQPLEDHDTSWCEVIRKN